MNVIIAEDEKLAAERLENLVRQCDPSIQIAGRYDSVEDLVTYFSQHTTDLMFLDVQLADGKSFEVFKKVKVTAPIIFTTAYDQYALQAFKLHSIDYLLKPIQEEELRFALKKFNTLRSLHSLDANQWDVLKQLAQIQIQTYKQRFLVKSGNRLFYKQAAQVGYFFAEGKLAYLVTRLDNRKFVIDHTLEELETLLDPKCFFRISRKFIINLEAVAEVKRSVSNMEVYLSQKTDMALSVSRDKIQNFKEWLDR